MEKKVVNIFYLGIAQGESYRDGHKGLKDGLPIKVLKEMPEYPGGCLSISYALLPEFGSRSLFSGKGKPWRRKSGQKILSRTLEKMKNIPSYSECVISRSLENKVVQGRFPVKTGADETFEMPASLPQELTATHLHSYAPFEKVGVIFSKESGTFEAREVILLLAPYLKRMRQVLLVGEESPATELLTEYLYYEYGVIAERYQVMPQRYVGKKTEMIWIETGNRSAYRTMAMGASEMFGWINRQETLKFLDTVIKNGYNTES